MIRKGDIVATNDGNVLAVVLETETNDNSEQTLQILVCEVLTKEDIKAVNSKGEEKLVTKGEVFFGVPISDVNPVKISFAPHGMACPNESDINMN